MYVRKPAVAGSFYPADAKRLGAMIDKYIGEAVLPSGDGDIVAVVSPHAGYIYSGPVAAYGYKALADVKPDIVIVLAPSHRARFNGASVIPEGMYETPLGKVPIDDVIGNSLCSKPAFAFIEEVHAYEHSLEVQVPFLQRTLEKFLLVPVIVGTTDFDLCSRIAGELFNAIRDEKRKIAVVISTDLSHYHPYQEAVRLDSLFIEKLKEFDEKALSDFLGCGSAEACGEGPLVTGLILGKLMGAVKAGILRYANSGDTAGDKSQVVGYVSAVFYR